MTPIVIVVRDPDASNTYTVFDGEVETYDIDCGRMDLSDADEFAEWAASHLASADELEPRHPEAAENIREIVYLYAESNGHDLVHK